MLRSFLITCLLAIASITSAFSQELKISAVDATDTKLYNNVAPKTLGKPMTLGIYDNSATVKFDKENIALKETSSNNYSKVERDTDTEIHTWTLTVEKTLGVVTSATLKYLISEKVGKYRTASFTIKAKRF